MSATSPPGAPPHCQPASENAQRRTGEKQERYLIKQLRNSDSVRESCSRRLEAMLHDKRPVVVDLDELRRHQRWLAKLPDTRRQQPQGFTAQLELEGHRSRLPAPLLHQGEYDAECRTLRCARYRDDTKFSKDIPDLRQELDPPAA